MEEKEEFMKNLNDERNRQNYTDDDYIVMNQHLENYLIGHKNTTIDELLRYFFHGSFDRKTPPFTLSELASELARLEEQKYVHISGENVIFNNQMNIFEPKKIR